MKYGKKKQSQNTVTTQAMVLAMCSSRKGKEMVKINPIAAALAVAAGRRIIETEKA